ncbi:acyl-homoserine-lactone synthase [Flavimaricola marinus]|uniref:Acyl-homoserine-lactone synthase n=1 Tax=Flavimaricola marinus TaxID=1819565 RepID=A0A238L8X4_9RHOB|nr:acyl-homoserine-lactone synthase [Flavimaricola marinus]SMY06051.1 Acyl-homoserine-lactone synthase [Flavimaricola marinus]
MLRYIYGSDLNEHSRLADSMFRDRAEQFHNRLGWDVTVDSNGWERDEYDDLNPLYVIWERPGGLHGGSMRFLPTTGQTMVNDHFLHLTDGVRITSPFIWECTRFCLSPEADGRIAAALMLAGGEIMRGFDISHFVGVFDSRMVRIYRMIGASPDVLGQDGTGRDKIAVGLWAYDPASRSRVLQRAGLSSDLSEHWFQRSFGRPVAMRLAG